MAGLTNDAISALLQSGINKAVGYGGSSKLSEERKRVAQYYDAEKPGLMHAGDAEYRSMDVYTGIESMKAQLLEVFSGNTRPVVFTPMPGETDEQAKFRTDHVTGVIFSQNPGFQILQTVIEDALKARNGLCKVWWEPSVETVYYDMSEPVEEQIIKFLADDPTASVDSVERDDNAQLARVRFKCTRDRSQVRITPLPPEEFGISDMAPSIAEADLVFHRHSMTLSQMIKHGYSRDLIDTLQDDDRLVFETQPEVIQRFNQTDDIIGLMGDDGDTTQRRFTVYECYTHLDMEGEGEAQLYKVDICGSVVLDKEPVSYKPFVDFCALPRSHAFWGSNYGLLLVPTQNARTYLTRAIINHALITTNPRMMVAQGGLLNPRELMENRFGGIVNVKSLTDSVAPLNQASLNPFVFQTITQLQQAGEEVSGISSLSQGLNKDAVSKQNSQGMIQDLISVSQIRQKIVARNFAEGFLRHLYTLVYTLVRENESPQKLAQESRGVWVPVDFTQWPESAELDVSFSLGYGEQEKEAEKYLKIDQYLAGPANGLQQFYPTQKRFVVLSRILENMGIKDATSIILSPDQIQPTPPDPAKQADIAVKQADAQAKMATAHATQVNSQLALEEARQKATEAMAKIQLQTEKVKADQQLKQDQFAHKVTIDAHEVLLQDQALAQGEATARIQPS